MEDVEAGINDVKVGAGTELRRVEQRYPLLRLPPIQHPADDARRTPGITIDAGVVYNDIVWLRLVGDLGTQKGIGLPVAGRVGPEPGVETLLQQDGGQLV
jgi:hypothetical protein